MSLMNNRTNTEGTWPMITGRLGRLMFIWGNCPSFSQNISDIIRIRENQHRQSQNFRKAVEIPSDSSWNCSTNPVSQQLLQLKQYEKLGALKPDGQNEK